MIFRTELRFLGHHSYFCMIFHTELFQERALRLRSELSHCLVTAELSQRLIELQTIANKCIDAYY